MKVFKIKFFENRKIYFGISIGIMLIGLIFNVIFGTQLDIQFSGGAMIKYSYTGSVQQGEAESIVRNLTKKDVTVRVLENVKSADGSATKNNLSISFAGSSSISVDEQQAIVKALTAKYPNAGFQVIESSSVNPTMGRTFFVKCLAAVAIAFLLLLIYIAFRFQKIGGMPAGVMAIIALLHDVAMVYFTFIIFQIPLNDNFIAVVLTILGYSLNDTIIIYDRIRENKRLMGPKTSYGDLVDTSINQTFTRSLYTAGCTFATVLIVFIVGQIFGLASVTTFALPMMVGVTTGCYSSVCIAGPLYVMWENHKAAQKVSEAK
ncbi:MAG TPA: protein translocase subunit SecF [Caproiciproducens sp.]|nr:protein translocase subunit SecF [Caproiciproducens sp.]